MDSITEWKQAPGRRKREELEFLPAALEVLDTPPNPAGRFMLWLVIIIFLTAIAWASFGTVDMVSVASGRIIPSARVKVVQPLETGVVRAIHVRDGQKVKKGDVLIELDPTDSQANAATFKYELIKAQLEAAAANALLENRELIDIAIPNGADPLLARAIRDQTLGEMKKYRASVEALKAQVDELKSALRGLDIQKDRLKKVLPLIKDRLQTQEKLFRKGYTSKPIVLALRQEKIERSAELAGIAEQRAQYMDKINALSRRMAELDASFRASALERRANALKTMASLRQSLKKEKRRNQYRRLMAPVDGTVLDLRIHTIGAVVSSAQPVLKVVPAGSRLEIEALVLNRDIGFIHEGQPVEIKLEAFPFTRYGLLSGRLKQLGRDAIQDPKLGLVFRALITLDQDRIKVKNKWVALVPGMTVQAEIKTGERRLIEYFLSPFKQYQQEALRER